MIPTNLPIAFSGAPGAYSEEAALRFFGPSFTTLTCSSSKDALKAISEGRAQRAVVPVENTVTGFFDGLVEALSERSDLGVVGEVVLPIRHCLMAAPGTKLEDIAVVTSHQSALSQCRDWLTSIGVSTRPASDTGRAAEELATNFDSGLGVLGSRRLANRYGLNILAEGLSDHSDNRTRFYVLGPIEEGAREQSNDAGTRTAVLLGPVSEPRALKTLRIQLESHGAMKTRSPFLGSQDGARFLVEFDHAPGNGLDIVEVGANRPTQRFLGSWRP
ncbi:MAG: prephenate dehydratase [Planctomycetota bacterium]|jgi:prephenate dehydratase